MRKRNKTKFSMQPVLVDIVIPVYRKIDFLKRCLDCIPNAAKDIPYKIWIHDNGTPPEEKGDFYKSLTGDKNITVLQTKDGVGYPKACNFGAKRGNAPLIMILTNDVFLKEDAIVHLVREMDNPQTGICGMKLLFPEGSPHGPAEKVQHTGIEFNIRAEPYHQFIGWSSDNPKVLAKREAYAVTGAVFIVRRNLWKEIGGFWEGYGLGTYEDMELCVRVRELGYNIKVSQEAVGYHWVNGSELGYPLGQNRNLFMSRCGQKILYTEWLYW